MPTYDFMNNETGEEFTEIMTMSERVTYLAENPHMKTFPASQKHIPTLLSQTSRVAVVHGPPRLRLCLKNMVLKRGSIQ
jgi:hypothetical protein